MQLDKSGLQTIGGGKGIFDWIGSCTKWKKHWQTQKPSEGGKCGQESPTIPWQEDMIQWGKKILKNHVGNHWSSFFQGHELTYVNLTLRNLLWQNELFLINQMCK